MKFLALYVGAADPEEKASLSEERINALMADWARWMSDNETAIVDPGAPLGATLRVQTSGITPTRNMLVGYTIVEADSHEAAAALFAAHPHLRLLPGNAIEVMECPEIEGEA